MKAISLWQPWASLIFTPVKVHETRHWRPPEALIGERVIIHAAKTARGFREASSALHDICYEEFGCGSRYSLPMGAAIGTVAIEGCYPTDTHQPAHDDDALAGNWSAGRFAWKLSLARAFKTPVPMRGAQGFWTPAEDLSAAQGTQRPARGEQHFHVCEACFHIWVHKAEAAHSHRCPRCESGPFHSGWLSYRNAHEEMVRLKAFALSAAKKEG